MEVCEFGKFLARDSNNGNTIFHDLAYEGSLRELQKIRDTYDKQWTTILQETNKKGESCIHVAADMHRGSEVIRLIKVLVDLGADPSAPNTLSSCTVLHIAIYHQDCKLARWLCQQRKVDIHARYWDGLTAYQLALVQNNKRMMNILRIYGADCEEPSASKSESSDV